jgi:hypothetical protein
MMPSLSPKGLQYGPREILLLFFAIALLIGGTIYLCQDSWQRNAFEFYLFVFSFSVGVIFYTIGCSIRHRTPERRLKCSTKVVSILILIITGIILFYLLWAMYRTQNPDFYANPSQAWLHPDQAILWLNQYYDRKFPVTPGHFKMHGELDRVRWTIFIMFAPLIGIMGWRFGVLLPVKLGYVFSFFTRIKRFFLSKK